MICGDANVQPTMPVGAPPRADDHQAAERLEEPLEQIATNTKQP